MTRILWARLLAGLALLGLAVTLVVLGPPRQEAAAADSRAEADSPVTVHGEQGKYEDFSDLAITVAQTQGLGGQGVEVTWEGGNPTPYGAFGRDYLSIMQCWGPDPDAPEFRETCQFGSDLDVPFPGESGYAGRSVSKALDPDETHEPVLVQGEFDPAPVPIDTLPFRSSLDRTYLDAGTMNPPTGGSVPRPAPDGYAGLIRDVFNRNSTNEQPWVPIGGDGNGRTVFWVQTAKESPHLGCGRVSEDGLDDPQSCWLVVVPRGGFDSAGNPRPAESAGAGDSPLSLTNFANKIAIELNFLPVSGFCTLGSQEVPTVGTELVTEAMTSWQPALCADGPTFGYAATGDSAAASQLLSGAVGAPGLAFTVDPIVAPEGGPAIVHAPVAVSGMTIGFNIDFRPKAFAPPEVEARFGTQVEELKLTPRLVAKMLTQSYWGDIPIVPGSSPPEELGNNPQYVTYDPEFLELNPDFLNFPPAASGPKGLMVANGNSAANREIWRWILADEEAVEWLEGTPDENDIVVNPSFDVLDLTAGAREDFPKADDTCIRVPATATADLCTLDYRPYLDSYAFIAQRVLRDDVAEKFVWDPLRSPPQYVTSAPRSFGKRWAVGITETASTDRYGVYNVSLRNAAGEFVAPTEESMQAALKSMTDSDGDGVLEPDPTIEDPAAYPLTLVTYAAVNATQEPAMLNDYATLLTYVSDKGQQPGTARGELPPGYLPLTPELREQTQTVAEDLRALASPTPTPTPTPSDTAPAPQGPDPSDNGDVPPPRGPDYTPPPGPGYTPPPDDSGPTNSPSPGPPAPAPSPSQTPSPSESSTPVARSSTPGTDAGIAPYVLMVVLLIGAAAAIAGPALTKLGSRFNGSA